MFSQLFTAFESLTGTHGELALEVATLLLPGLFLGWLSLSGWCLGNHEQFVTVHGQTRHPVRCLRRG